MYGFYNPVLVDEHGLWNRLRGVEVRDFTLRVEQDGRVDPVPFKDPPDLGGFLA